MQEQFQFFFIKRSQVRQDNFRSTAESIWNFIAGSKLRELMFKSTVGSTVPGRRCLKFPQGYYTPFKVT